jgi:hypothetical protein
MAFLMGCSLLLNVVRYGSATGDRLTGPAWSTNLIAAGEGIAALFTGEGPFRALERGSSLAAWGAVAVVLVALLWLGFIGLKDREPRIRLCAVALLVYPLGMIVLATHRAFDGLDSRRFWLPILPLLGLLLGHHLRSRGRATLALGGVCLCLALVHAWRGVSRQGRASTRSAQDQIGRMASDPILVVDDHAAAIAADVTNRIVWSSVDRLQTEVPSTPYCLVAVSVFGDRRGRVIDPSRDAWWAAVDHARTTRQLVTVQDDQSLVVCASR